jgi:hypothetical protein
VSARPTRIDIPSKALHRSWFPCQETHPQGMDTDRSGWATQGIQGLNRSISLGGTLKFAP